LAYARVMSNRRRAVPTISAASAIVARSSTDSNASGSIECAPADPEPASTSKTRREKSTVATGRVSGDCTSATVGPVDTIATQSPRSASGTTVFTGSSLAVQTPSAPATATVPVISPARAGASSSWPAAARSGANNATVGKNGPGAAT